MEIHSVTATPPSDPPARISRPSGFLELALAHQRMPAAAIAHGGAEAVSENAGFGFDDLLDIVNPLHHIPVIATFYRAMTDDEIAPAPRILGGALFGGIVGFAVAAANAVIEEITGKDAGEHIRIALLGDPDSPAPEPVMVASADPEMRDATAAEGGEETAGPAPTEPTAAPGDARTAAAPWQAPTRAAGPSSWYLAALRPSFGAGPSSTTPVDPSHPFDEAPSAVATAAAAPHGPTAATPVAQAGEHPIPARAGEALPRLSPAQIELLLASVGKSATVQSTPGDAALHVGEAGQGTESPAAASLAAAPLEGWHQQGTELFPPPFAQRILHGLDKYHSNALARAASQPRVDIVR